MIFEDHGIMNALQTSLDCIITSQTPSAPVSFGVNVAVSALVIDMHILSITSMVWFGV